MANLIDASTAINDAHHDDVLRSDKHGDADDEDDDDVIIIGDCEPNTGLRLNSTVVIEEIDDDDDNGGRTEGAEKAVDGDEDEIDFSKLVITDEDRNATLSTIFNDERERKREELESRMADYCNQAQTMKQSVYVLLEAKCGDDKANSSNGQSNDQSKSNNGVGEGVGWEKEIKEKIAKMKIALEAITNDNKPADENGQCQPEVQPSQSPASATAEETSEAIVDNGASTDSVVNKNENSSSNKRSNKKKSNQKVNKTQTQPDELSEAKPADVPLSSTQETSQSGSGGGKRAGNSKKTLTVEQLIKSLNTVAKNVSDEEKIRQLCEKYIQLLNEKESIEENSRKHELICRQLIRDKEFQQNDLNRAQLIKARLESLCRELQKQNKLLKDEMFERERANEARSKQILDKFQETLDDITALIRDNEKRNENLKNENKSLLLKLKTLMEHYEAWETNVDQVIYEKEIQVQLSKAQLAKTYLIMNEEKEKFLNEKHQLVSLIADLRSISCKSNENEAHLKAELSMYTSKYEEFQSILSRSNDMFNGVKKDMESMNKQIKKLEKETAKWKSRSESSNKALVLLANEKQKRDDEVVAALLKVSTLEKLCRAMQEERTQMQEKIKHLERSKSIEKNAEINQEMVS